MQDLEITLSSLMEEVSSLQFPSEDPYKIIDAWLLYHFDDPFEDLTTQIDLFPVEKMTPLEIISVFISYDMPNETSDPEIFRFAYDKLDSLKFFKGNKALEFGILNNIAVSYLRRGIHDKAKSFYQKANNSFIGHDPDDMIALSVEFGDYEEALNAIRRDLDASIRKGAFDRLASIRVYIEDKLNLIDDYSSDSVASGSAKLRFLEYFLSKTQLIAQRGDLIPKAIENCINSYKQ
ncbi:MAG: hypothetical protein NDI94_05645 [Candidatus Woesearchaeota archaeon]|nr:hypothetical protein [Candidatus Woesearchaeota archaeon]